jgi:exosome complex component RRP4
MSLHTRSLKYGKLRNGRLVIVPPTLVVRQKSHFHSLPYGIELIVGLNGYIWVQAPSAISKAESSAHKTSGDDWQPEASGSMAIYSSKNDPIDPDTRANIDRTAVCIELLAKHWISISLAHVHAAYDASLQLSTEDGLGVEVDQLHMHANTIIAALASA